jgi:hypothetical protein
MLPPSPDQNCMNDYYRTKRPACLDSILSLRQAPRPKSDPRQHRFRQLFITSPAENSAFSPTSLNTSDRSICGAVPGRLLDDARHRPTRISSAMLQKPEASLGPLPP